MKKIILITGGQRSGKSRFAESLALTLSPQPIYIATSRVWDEEYHQRILHHQANRGSEWLTIEEEKYLSHVDVNQHVVVIDCVTLWSTNFFFDLQGEPLSHILTTLKQEFSLFTQQTARFIFVSNEIGLGGTPDNTLQRQFTDLLGWFNQFIAEHADEVYFTVSGIPMKIKG